MNDSSVISGNRVTNGRCGHDCDDPCSVYPETAYGGGVSLAGGRLVMTGSSAIRGNTSRWLGGGLDAGATRYLTGVVCGPGGNVYDNTPDDCYIWYPTGG